MMFWPSDEIKARNDPCGGELQWWAAVVGTQERVLPAFILDCH